MALMPTLFISHGGPDIVLGDTAARRYLETLPSLMPRPRAIVVVSAHFETKGVAVVTDPRPAMIYDFGGFAPELYEMVYEAPGDPQLAERVVGLLDAAGLAPERLDRRGYDHGTWTPLKLAFPAADIPIVQVSIDPHRDAAWHFALGRALSPLRAEGVLLLGSGHITHNLRAFFSVRKGGAPDPALPGKVQAFTDWFAERFAAGDESALLDWRQAAPFPAENHPTDEPLMPIFFAYGAAGGARATARRAHASVEHGFFANDSWLFQ